MKEYALYKGEDVVAIGTALEIAEKLKVKKDTILYYGTNAYKRRLSKRNVKNARELICLD